jgi:putative polyhydroxyalkanoate system protein
MPKFDLEIPHSLPIDQVRARLEKARAKLESDYGATCTWQGEDTMVVARKGLNATVGIEAARLKVDVELGLLLTPMAGAIRSGITKQLTDLLA